MPKKKKTTILSFVDQLRKSAKDVDSSFQAFTGSSLKQFFTGALKDVADDAHEKASRPIDNYAILGVTPTDPPEQIKKVYKALIKVYHEAGLSPNGIKMREINNAYESICRERGWSK